jgi:nitrogen fixation protein NifU and related proteins
MTSHRDYSEILLDHYRNPRNAGDLEGADVVVTVGSPAHGDVMRLSLRISEDKVAEVGFKVFGCAAAIAAGSMMTEMIRGKSLEEVQAVTNLMVADALGGLPENKIHCSVLAEQALWEALAAHRAGTTQDEHLMSAAGDMASGHRRGPAPR